MNTAESKVKWFNFCRVLQVHLPQIIGENDMAHALSYLGKHQLDSSFSVEYLGIRKIDYIFDYSSNGKSNKSGA